MSAVRAAVLAGRRSSEHEVSLASAVSVAAGWKPARLGSAVGIVRVGGPDQLSEALECAFIHDPLTIVEAAARGREIECSLLSNDEPIASEPGEILLAAGEEGWYDFEAKYSPGGMRLVVPARIPSHVRERVRALAIKSFV